MEVYHFDVVRRNAGGNEIGEKWAREKKKGKWKNGALFSHFALSEQL